MSTANTRAHVGVLASQIWDRYPELEGQYRRMWRNLVKKGLSEQASRNAQSSMLKGMSDIIGNQWPYLEHRERAKLADMMTSSFRNNINSQDWNAYRAMLPNLFPPVEESDIMKHFIFRENEDDGAISIETVETVSNNNTTPDETACVIIIKGGSMNAQFNDVPQDIAYTVMSELAKSMA